MVTCGDCIYCSLGSEQFCTSGQMLGKNRDGGYAEAISVPARNAFSLPDEIPFEHGAIMVCSSATSFHALRKGRLEAGETVAVFGVGGLGMSAVQLARAFGALDVYAVDINADRFSGDGDRGATNIRLLASVRLGHIHLVRCCQDLEQALTQGHKQVFLPGDILIVGPCACQEVGDALAQRCPDRRIYQVPEHNDLMTNKGCSTTQLCHTAV